MTLKEMVKDKTVRFVCYRDGELNYITEDGFEFSVPIKDTGTGTFLAEDKAIFFMRWIRKQLDEQKNWDKIRSGGGPGSTCSKEEWFSQPKVLSGAGSEVESLPEDDWKYDHERPDEMTPELRAANARLINSIIRARIPEENILRFTEEDLEDQP